jgi:predicted site-specific integrase-resolvase
MKYYKTAKAAKLLGVHPNTLRAWDREGKISTIRTPSGQRLFDVSKFLQQEQKVLCYARVSSQKQKDDLQRQISYLQEKFPQAEIIKDIGSGINFKRKGLLNLINQIEQGRVGKVVVAHKDRLCRFAFDLLKQLFEKHGTQIVVLNEVSCSPEQELVQDLTTIVHVFSCRLHGLRKYSKTLKEDSDLPERRAKEEA